MWKKLTELVDLEEPIPWPRVFGKYPTWMQIEREYYCRTQEYVRIPTFCWNNWKVTWVGGNLTQKLSRGHTIWKDMRKMCGKILRTGQQKDCAVVQRFNSYVWTTITSRKKNRRRLETCPKVCWQVVFKCLYVARIGRFDMLTCTSCHKMDWTLWQTLSSFDILTFITRVTTDNCHVGNTAQHSRLRLFLDSDFAGDFEDSAATFGGIVMYLRKSNVCSYKLDVQGQTSVSHRSTDSEVISLDAGLRMDGIPAVGLWDLAIEVLDFFFWKKSSNIGKPIARWNQSKHQPQHQNEDTAKREVEELSNVDHVVTSAKPSLFEAQLHIFEDNDAVIKMIIEVRSPTMRHVPRNHRVSLDWLFDRINVDQQNQN